MGFSVIDNEGNGRLSTREAEILGAMCCVEYVMESCEVAASMVSLLTP